MEDQIDIVREIQYPKRMSSELVDLWAEIPIFSENDPKRPEWRRTPSYPHDLTSEGYGVIHVKDESDTRSNPTGTIKDRPAWELAALYRDFARGLYLQQRAGNLQRGFGSVIVPRFSIVTAGNVGNAVSNVFIKYGLPPMKILVDASASDQKLALLRGLHADLYRADLKKPLTARDIKRATNNDPGIDITSAVVVEPNATWYDWHVHETFNEDADEVYIPYGSGRLFENYLTWQHRNARTRDPRLAIPNEQLARMSVLAAEPDRVDSVADKLTKYHNPFVVLNGDDIGALRSLFFTGPNTGIYKIPEERICQAYELMSRQFETEPSACAGLALYLQRFDEGKVSPRAKVLIVNTGKGAFS